MFVFIQSVPKGFNSSTTVKKAEMHSKKFIPWINDIDCLKCASFILVSKGNDRYLVTLMAGAP